MNSIRERSGGSEIQMKKETEIDIAVSYASGSRYDEACKRLFRNREIIAPVLKEVVPEYRESTVEEIIRYIDADSICDMPIDDLPAGFGQLPTELSSVSDKLIRYDAHFRAVNPLLSDENLCIQLHIDLEVQNDYRPANPSYPIIKRGIYYAAREISYQLGTLTKQTNYGEIRKVYSIWICNERIPRKLQNTVTMYSLQKTDIIGETDEPEEDYDLMNVILIRRGKEETTPIFEYLSGVFRCDKELIAKYVDIRDNETVQKDVNDMSSLGQSMMMEALQQGMQQGIQQGMQQGMQKGENLLAALVGCLKRDGRIDDLDSIADEEARRRLYREYGLID